MVLRWSFAILGLCIQSLPKIWLRKVWRIDKSNRKTLFQTKVLYILYKEEIIKGNKDTHQITAAA